MYVYECPACDGTSDPYLTPWGARQFGAEHRDAEHAGLHPRGECVVPTAQRAPQGREWVAVALVALILLGSLVMR
ncbi:hypothetical protein SUDANB1_05624 [Streptomyces sp. enrichment culture]|uniref:hypothetical protein n=1 Tax=Streptomyces sp. enrichment culture TaxID=1795815 RepID=UPI003F5598C2